MARDDAKRERQALIATILTEREVPTQAELVIILKSMGCEAAQTSVARDMVEMGVQKVRALYGRSRYVMPQHETPNPEEHAIHALRSFCTHIDVAGTVTIVATSVGAASTLGTAIDGLHHPDIVGSLAGYDTLALFCSDAKNAASVRDYLQALRRSRDVGLARPSG